MHRLYYGSSVLESLSWVWPGQNNVIGISIFRNYGLCTGFQFEHKSFKNIIIISDVCTYLCLQRQLFEVIDVYILVSVLQNFMS